MASRLPVSTRRGAQRRRVARVTGVWASRFTSVLRVGDGNRAADALHKPGNRLDPCFATCVEFAILGTVEARANGKALELGGGKQRALLAVLILHANEAVSRDRLIDALWGERPPPSVHQSLDTYVSR